MIDIDSLVKNYRNHADVDYVGLWQIASRIEDELKSSSQDDVRHMTLDVIRKMMCLGVNPGDFAIGNSQDNGFVFWPGTENEKLNRIEAEWIANGKTPNLVDSICWFALSS